MGYYSDPDRDPGDGLSPSRGWELSAARVVGKSPQAKGLIDSHEARVVEAEMPLALKRHHVEAMGKIRSDHTHTVRA